MIAFMTFVRFQKIVKVTMKIFITILLLCTIVQVPQWKHYQQQKIINQNKIFYVISSPVKHIIL